MAIDKVNTISYSAIAKLMGVTKANIAKFGTTSVPSSFTNTKSLFTDGVNDFFEIDLASDIIPHTQGSISSWFKIDSSNTSTKFMYSIYDASQTSAGRIELQFFNTSGNTVFALNGVYNDEISDGTFQGRFCNAKTGASHHGKPWNRIASDYGSFGSSTDSVYNANAMKGNWHNVIYTWDTTDTYVYNSTTYNGVLKLYLDGTLVNFGQSNFASHNGTANAQDLIGIDSGTVFDKIKIGARWNNNNDIDMLTDEFAIFNTVLDASDATNIYNSGVPGDLSSYSDLVGWWRFEDDSTDSSSNSNSGTLTNGATFSSDIPS